MPVRKTESRLPAGFPGPDLGQSAAAAGNANIVLVSYLSSPVVRERMQHYVVFVADTAVAPTVGQYDWTVNDAGTPHTQRTDAGVLEYTPQNLGALSVSVNVLNGAGTTIATVSLQQQVVPLFAELEAKIDEDEARTPNAAHPETSREFINDLRRYADAVAPPASDDLLDRLLLALGYAVTLRIPRSSQVVRNQRLDNAARVLNENRHADFLRETENGIGLAEPRPHLLAMCLNKSGSTPAAPYIAFTRIPASGRARNTALTGIRTAFNALAESDKIDLFNLMRFPKTHFRMCKTVFERLRDEYYSGQAMQALLGDNTKTDAIIGHYQEGGIARQVRGLMRHPVWAFVPPVGAGGGAAGGGGGPLTPPNIGSFEKIPVHTFVAQPTPTDNGFIPSAFAYHETYGLAPVSVPSMEDIIDRLSQNAGHLDRIRIVSHFSLAEHGFISAIMMRFFTAQTDRKTEWWHFKFAISKEEGLRAFFEDRVPVNYQHICESPTQDDPADLTHRSPLWRVILKALRANQPAVLTPFGLSAAGSSPSGQLQSFIKFCGDLFVLNTHTIQVGIFPGPTNTEAMPQSSKDVRIAYINSQIDALRPAITTGSRTEAQVNALKTAIATLPPANLPVPLASPMGTFTFGVEDIELLRDHAPFIAKVNTVKARFNSSSFVDIRGCRVGQDARYMNAVREFFGVAGNLPTVTAPEWFQSFGALGFISDGDITGGTPTPDQEKTLREGNFRSLFNSGGGGLSAADIQRAYTTWAGRIGIPSHVSFWSRLCGGDAVEFLEYAWKDQLPPLAMDAVRLRNFSALTYPAAIVRLGEIFNLPSTVIPAPADIATFTTNLLPRIPTLRAEERAVNLLTAASPPADLTARNTAIQQLATQMSQTLPAAPAPLTIDYLRQCIDQLKTHVRSTPNIAPMLAAIQTKISEPVGGFLYLVFSGMALTGQQSGTEVNRRYYFLRALRDDAMKTFMKIHWADPLPVGNMINGLAPVWDPATTTNGSGVGLTFTDLGRMLQVSALSDDHANTHVATNPDFEFQQHIKSAP